MTKLLGGRYELLEKIGGGGMATVYKARDTLLQRVVAVKILRNQFVSDPEFVRRFRREAQNAASLSHPNIVAIYDVGEDHDDHYIVMEYVAGRTLKDIIKEHAPLPVSQALAIAAQIGRALEHAHRHRIIHRDIKPHNILITADGRAKVTDFGIARAATTSTLTHSGTIMGSVHYISPEQANGEAAGEKSDIYALGVVLYEMLTGQVPFDGPTPLAVVMKHVQEMPVPVRQLNPAVPEDVERVVMRCLRKPVDERYPSAEALVHDLEAALKGLPVSELGEDLDEPTLVIPGSPPPPAKKRRTLAPWVVWTVLAVVALGAVALAAWRVVVWFNVPDVTVPQVTGMNVMQAQETLHQAGLESIIVGNPYSDQPAGTVLSQDPQNGTVVKQNFTVQLVISKGPQMVAVPNVVGQPEAQAELTLTNAGFAVSVQDQFSDQWPAGTVISQDPSGGKLENGQTVTIVVSKGAPSLVMPDFGGLSLADARSQLASLGLVEGTVIPQPSTAPAQTVLSTDPAPGTPISAGQRVNLVISSGPPASQHSDTVQYTVPASAPAGVDVKIDLYVDGARIGTVYWSTQNPGDVVTTPCFSWEGSSAYVEIMLGGNVVMKQALNGTGCH